jgi:hypothetical protein
LGGEGGGIIEAFTLGLRVYICLFRIDNSDYSSREVLVRREEDRKSEDLVL